MPISTKTKSPHGESGQEGNSEVEVVKEQEIVVDCEKLHTLENNPSISVPKPEDAQVAEESVNSDPVLSLSDRKLADRMTREIANHLGLGGRSRSVRI